MTSTRAVQPPSPLEFRARLGLHHFSHLRTVAEGQDVRASAVRYLGVEHGNAAMAAHRAVVERLRAVARRRGDKRWRLIGVSIGAGQAADTRPTLDEWAAEQGLDDWSQAELQELYREAFPLDRRSARNERLRERVMAMLRELEAVAAERASPQDPIDAWLDPDLAERMKAAGLTFMHELQAAVARGGRWWRSIRAVGVGKARRIEEFLEQLLPASPVPVHRHFVVPALLSGQGAGAVVPALGSPQQPGSVLSAGNDAEAIEAWIQARAGSQATAKAYQREARRLCLWAAHERGKDLAALTVEDCLAYLAFLQHVPEAWIARRKVSPLSAGWAPFSGQLSEASQKQALVIVSGLYAWLVDAGHLPRNPWSLINRKFSQDPNRSVSRAFEVGAWTAMLDWIEAQPASPSKERILFVLRFTEATGLRATELVSATIGSMKQDGAGRWSITIKGKGEKIRTAAVPSQAERALERYLRSRSLPALQEAPAHVPLLASVDDGMQPVRYHALYSTVRSWITRTLRHAPLSEAARRSAERSSVHWLRHTCATRAIERGAPLDVVQGQLGHADPRMTMRYAKAQIDRLHEGMELAFADEED